MIMKSNIFIDGKRTQIFLNRLAIKNALHLNPKLSMAEKFTLMNKYDKMQKNDNKTIDYLQSEVGKHLDVNFSSLVEQRRKSFTK